MSTLYLDRKNLSIEVDGGSLTLRQNNEIRQRIPISLIERIVIAAGVDLNTNTLLQLSSNQVSITMIGSRASQLGAQVISFSGGDVQRRLSQYALYFNESLQVKVVRALLLQKLRQQRLLLHNARKIRHDVRYRLTKAIDSIGNYLSKLPTIDSLESLMGYEGAAAARYFEAYASLFPESLGFCGRAKRPPTDPVNACLSLGYTMIHHEAARIINGAGLDVYLGVLHRASYNRGSLALDIIEPLRAKIDFFTWRLFAEKKLRQHHFSERDGGFYLTKEGRAIYYPLYEALARGLRRVIKKYVYLYVVFLRKSDLI